MTANYSTQFRSIKDEVSPEEWETRLNLAACYRLTDVYGMTDLIYNHITARIPGDDDLFAAGYRPDGIPGRDLGGFIENDEVEQLLVCGKVLGNRKRAHQHARG